jgi:hypothetical protein
MSRVRTKKAIPAPYLCLEGDEEGPVDGPRCQAAEETLASVGQMLQAALEKSGRSPGRVGTLTKVVTVQHGSHEVRHWQLLLPVSPWVTAASLELAKYLAGVDSEITLVRAPPKRSPQKRVAPSGYAAAA